MKSFGLFVPAAQMDSKIMWKINFWVIKGSFRFLLVLSFSLLELLFNCVTV